jgi:L-fuculose-phosphate aldolase
MSDENTLRIHIARLASQMYARDFISNLSGNISVRLPDDTLLLTPAGIYKSELKPEDMVVVDQAGNCLRAIPGRWPTSELPMHLEAYRQRADVQAIIHAHPITCIALSLVGISLEDAYIPEALQVCGPVPTTRFAMPSSTENQDVISDLIADHDAILLAHHGTLTVGSNLDEAYVRLETLEHTARILALAYMLGKPRQLEPAVVEKLLKSRKSH